EEILSVIELVQDGQLQHRLQDVDGGINSGFIPNRSITQHRVEHRKETASAWPEFSAGIPQPPFDEFLVVEADSNATPMVMNGKNQVGRGGPPAQAVFPVMTQLAIEGLDRFPFFRL